MGDLGLYTVGHIMAVCSVMEAAPITVLSRAPIQDQAIGVCGDTKHDMTEPDRTGQDRTERRPPGLPPRTMQCCCLSPRWLPPSFFYSLLGLPLLLLFPFYPSQCVCDRGRHSVLSHLAWVGLYLQPPFPLPFPFVSFPARETASFLVTTSRHFPRHHSLLFQTFHQRTNPRVSLPGSISPLPIAWLSV